MKLAAALPMIVALVGSLPVPAHACSVPGCLDRGAELHASFTVSVSHSDKPVSGASLAITRYGNDKRVDVFTGTTSGAGSVQVDNLAPGDYWFSAEYLGISAAEFCFYVAEKPSAKAEKAVKVDWGTLAPASRRLAGKIVELQPGRGGSPIWNITHSANVPVVGVELVVRDVKGTEVEHAWSNGLGEFDVGLVADGTYVIHLERPQAGTDQPQLMADLLVEVSASAEYDNLLLTKRLAAGGSCGGVSLDLRRKEE